MEGSGCIPDVFLDPEPMLLDGLNWRWGVEVREVKDDAHVPGFRTFRTNLLKMFEKKQSYEIKGQQLIEGLEIWKER